MPNASIDVKFIVEKPISKDSLAMPDGSRFSWSRLKTPPKKGRLEHHFFAKSAVAGSMDIMIRSPQYNKLPAI